jgi:hypothetical protein
MTRSSFLPQSRTINMSQSPIDLSYTLEDVLARLEGKIDNLSKDAGDLKVGQTELAGQVKALDERLLWVVILTLFCHSAKTRRIYAVSDNRKSRFKPTLIKEG